MSSDLVIYCLKTEEKHQQKQKMKYFGIFVTYKNCALYGFLSAKLIQQKFSIEDHVLSLLYKTELKYFVNLFEIS